MLISLSLVLFGFRYFSWIVFFLSWWKWANSYPRLSSLRLLFIRIFSFGVGIGACSGWVVWLVRCATWDSSFGVKYLLKYFDTFIGLFGFLLFSISRFSRNCIFLICIFGVLCLNLFFCTTFFVCISCLHFNVFPSSRTFCSRSLALIIFVLLVFFAHVFIGSF